MQETLKEYYEIIYIKKKKKYKKIINYKKIYFDIINNIIYFKP